MSSGHVLFANHTSELAGAERSLLDLLASLDGAIESTIACPRGELYDALGDRRRVAIRGTDVSFRPHPIETPRGVAALAHTALQLRGAAREAGATVIDANTERAGLSAIAARALGAPPVVAHVRGSFPGGPLSRAVAAALGRARAVVASSRHVARQLGPRADVWVIPDPVDLTDLDPARVPRAEARRRFGLAAGDEAIAIIGYLAPVKAQDDAIRMLAELRKRRPAARLLITGSARFGAAGARFASSEYVDSLVRLAHELGVSDAVSFVGERSDVPKLLAGADLAIVPSLHEGFGRVVVEAMAMELPVIATNVGGPAEILRDGAEGRLLPPRQPSRWAEVAAELLADSKLAREMGKRGRARALAEYAPSRHAQRMIALYEEVGSA